MGIISQKLLSEIELIVFDFDGVFTDNSVYVNEEGTESVRCWRSDGLGLERLRSNGVKLHIISTEINPVVSLRAKKLGLDCIQGVQNKASTLIDICRSYSIALEKTMFVGNDINDIPAFQAVGIGVAVADAYDEISSYVMLRTKKNGGMGAVREICDIVFEAKRK